MCSVKIRVSESLADYLKECQRHEKKRRKCSKVTIPEISEELAINMRFTLPPSEFFMKKRR